MEQFLSASQDKGVLAHNEIASWLQELKAADVKGQFTFSGVIFAVAGRR